MKLKDLQDKLASDLPIDTTQLMSETADNIKKHSFYFNQLITNRALYRKAAAEFKVVERDRYNFYAGIGKEVYDYNLDSRAIKYNLEGDSILLAKQTELNMIELRIEFLVKACDLIKDRGFAIRNQIDLLRFQNGV